MQDVLIKVRVEANQVGQATKKIRDDINRVNTSTSKTNKEFKNMGDAIKTATPIDSYFRKGSVAIKSTTESLNTFSNSFSGISESILGVVGLLGVSSLATEVWSATTLRETSKIQLGMQRGEESAEKLYDRIQEAVVALPGDDKFLTNLLAMSASMDKSLAEEDISSLATVIANYEAAAKAKGQLSNETEREIRGYILSGSTRALTNSVLGSEVDTLKNKNTIMERAIALEKAMQKTGFDSMATYNSLSNATEELKGHFQKSFADVGSFLLEPVKLLINLYNTVDNIFGQGLSSTLVSLGLGLTALTAGIYGAGKGVDLLITGLHSFNGVINSVSALSMEIKSLGGISAFVNTNLRTLAETSALFDSTNALGGLFSHLTGIDSAKNVEYLTNKFTALAKVKPDNLTNALSAMGKDTSFLEDVFAKNEKGEFKNKGDLALLSNVSTSFEKNFENKTGALARIGNSSSKAVGGIKFSDISGEHNKLVALSASEGIEKLRLNYKEFGLTQKEANNIALEAEANLRKHIASSMLDKEVTDKNTSSNFKNSVSKEANASSNLANTASTEISTAAEIENTSVKELNTFAHIKNILIKIKDTIITNAKAAAQWIMNSAEALAAGIGGTLIGIIWGKTFAKIGETSATIDEIIAEEGEALTTAQVSALKGVSIGLRIRETIVKIEETFETWTNTASKIAEGTAEETNILIKVKKIGLTINSIIITVNDTISTFLKSEANATETATEEISNLSKLKSIGLRIQVILTNINSTITIYAHAAANIVDAFAQGLFNLQVGETISLMAILTAPLTVVILLVGGLAIGIYEVGKAFGWWENVGQVFEAIGAGIGRLWDAFMNSEPVKAIQNFIYTIQSAINSILPVLQFFWSNLFGGDENTEGNGVWDIAGQIIDTLGAIFGFLYQISGLKVIVDVINFIGQGIGSLLDALNLFYDSALSQEMFGALQEAFDSLKEPFMEIWDAFSEVGSAIGEIFSAFSDGDNEDSKSQMNWWIGIIKSIAQFIINYLVPAIKMIAVAIKVVITPFKLIANWMQICIGLFKGLITGDWSTFNKGISGLVNTFRPLYNMVKWIVDNAQGIWNTIFGGGKNTKKINSTPTSKVMPTQAFSYSLKDNKLTASPGVINASRRLATAAVNKATNGNTINNYNIGQGAFPVDARNMTQKEAAKTMQLAFGGYLNRRRVTR